MTQERNRKSLLELVNQPERKTLPPGYELESKRRFTAGDFSYIVRVCFVDLKTVTSGIDIRSYPQSNTLIKYSEARFSPVSSEPTDKMQLATPSYYRSFNAEPGSEFIGDDLESAFIERRDSFTNVRNVKQTLKWTPRSESWMYCTSIDPVLSNHRSKQMQTLSRGYDFMTRISQPSAFAEQLGCDVGQQIDLGRDFKYRPAGKWEFTDAFRETWGTISSMSKDQSLGGQRRKRVDFLVSVNHGPVIYLEEDEIKKTINNVPDDHGGAIVPFLKRKKYKEQREYRFVIRVRYHSPNKDNFYLNVSDKLRKLMAPILTAFR